jgi:hypothetical protein
MRRDLIEQLEEKYLYFDFHTLDVADGWFSLIDQMFDDICQLGYIKTDFQINCPRFIGVHIKEKYGTMRVSLSFCTSEMMDIIENYEHQSRCICEQCGELGEVKLINHWYQTLCQKHYDQIMQWKRGDK